MNTTNPIADLLTRIRNAKDAGLTYATIPASKLKIEITKILETEGFVRGFRLIKNEKQGLIKIALKYDESGKSAIRGLERISKPGCRVYKASKKLPRVRGGLGCVILSTSKGILTNKLARSEKVGGEILAYIW